MAYLAPSLVRLRSSVNAAFPNRDKSSDGWLGDAAHAARQSEHNPDSKGCVHAIDVDIDDGDAGRDLRTMLLKACIGHRAVWYVISNGVIYSRTYGWKARKYTGPNGHFKHVHISIRLASDAENDTTLVLGKTTAVTPAKPPVEDDMPTIEEVRAAVQAELEEYGVRLLAAPTGTGTKFMADTRAQLKDIVTRLERIEARQS